MNEITRNLKITKKQVITVLNMLEEGNTVPFIARYRKEQTGALDEEQIRDIHKEYEYKQNLLKRKEDVIRLIDEKGLYIVNPQFDDVKLYDLGINYYVKSDYIDYESIAEMIFDKSSSSDYLGYDNNTTLSRIIDDYPDVDISDLESYSLEIKTPNIVKSDIIEMGAIKFGFDEKTYSETPIYKTVNAAYDPILYSRDGIIENYTNANNYSSGLSYYYFISTLTSILIMVMIKKFFVDEDKLKAKMAVGKW